MTLIHRYPAEFTDEGTRHLLPILDPSPGVGGWADRWSPSALPTSGSVALWESDAGSVLSQGLAASRPAIITAGSARAAQFAGGSQSLNGAQGGIPTDTDPLPVQAITVLLRLDETPTSTTGIIFTGTGQVQIGVTNLLSEWTLKIDGSGQGAPVVAYDAPLTVGQWTVVSVCMPRALTHEISVGKTHASGYSDGSARGISGQLAIGRGNSSYAKASIMEVITWPRPLTIAERETLADTLPQIRGLA